jgi:hypothetical protein
MAWHRAAVQSASRLHRFFMTSTRAGPVWDPSGGERMRRYRLYMKTRRRARVSAGLKRPILHIQAMGSGEGAATTQNWIREDWNGRERGSVHLSLLPMRPDIDDLPVPIAPTRRSARWGAAAHGVPGILGDDEAALESTSFQERGMITRRWRRDLGTGHRSKQGCTKGDLNIKQPSQQKGHLAQRSLPGSWLRRIRHGVATGLKARWL